MAEFKQEGERKMIYLATVTNAFSLFSLFIGSYFFYEPTKPGSALIVLTICAVINFFIILGALHTAQDHIDKNIGKVLNRLLEDLEK